MEEQEKARRAELVAQHGEDGVFNTRELQEKFEVQGFGGGIVVVKRKSDGVRGSLDFDHSPRLYYGFMEA